MELVKLILNDVFDRKILENLPINSDIIDLMTYTIIISKYCRNEKVFME